MTRPPDSPIHWRLEAPETGDVYISHQGARGVLHGYGLRNTSSSGLADGEASTLPATSDAPTVSVTDTLWAESPSVDLKPYIQTLERMARRTPKYNRRPYVVLTWPAGSIEGFLADLQVTEPTFAFNAPPYNPRGYQVSVTVARSVQRSLRTKTAATVIEKATPQSARKSPGQSWRIGPGETFESIALAAYGDAMLGILLRPINAQVAMFGERAGDVITVPLRTHPMMEQPLQPVSAALQGDVSETLQTLALDRSTTRGVSLAALEAELGL